MVIRSYFWVLRPLDLYRGGVRSPRSTFGVNFCDPHSKKWRLSAPGPSSLCMASLQAGLVDLLHRPRLFCRTAACEECFGDAQIWMSHAKFSPPRAVG